MSQVTCGQMVIYNGYEKDGLRICFNISRLLVAAFHHFQMWLLAFMCFRVTFKTHAAWLAILEWDFGVIISSMMWAFISGSNQDKRKEDNASNQTDKSSVSFSRFSGVFPYTRSEFPHLLFF